jgi:hypothetical protein
MVLAQTDTTGFAIERSALAAYQNLHASLSQSFFSSQPLMYDPVVIHAWYDHEIHRDTGSPPAAPRDSLEAASLAGALNATLLAQADLKYCEPTKSLSDCIIPSSPVTLVAIGRPHLSHDTATVLLRAGPPQTAGKADVAFGRLVDWFLIRLVPSGSAWKVRCLTNVASDLVIPSEIVEAECQRQ